MTVRQSTWSQVQIYTEDSFGNENRPFLVVSTSSRSHSQFGNQVETHPVEQLVFLQHDQSDGIHLLDVEVELHAGWRVAQEVPLVLRDAWMEQNKTKNLIYSL